MVLTLKNGASKKEIKAIEKKIFKNASVAGFNARKYKGVVALNEDAMVIQDKFRNEWN